METTIFQNLTKAQIEQLVHLIQKIVQAFSPIKIICYGYRTTTISDWSCFSYGDARVRPTYPAYDLMIITKDDEQRQHLLFLLYYSYKTIFPKQTLPGKLQFLVLFSIGSHHANSKEWSYN